MSLRLLEKFTRHRPIFYKSTPSISNRNKEITQPKQSEPVENKPIRTEKFGVQRQVRDFQKINSRRKMECDRFDAGRRVKSDTYDIG